MSRTAKAKKDQTFWNILSTAIELDFKKGHLKWTLSDLSRKSRVTRSLIYYYFGRSKMAILNEAIKIIGDELVGLNEERLEMWRKGQLTQSLLIARSFHEKAPFISSFVMANVRADNQIGERLRTIQEQYIRKIKTFFPHLTPAQVHAVYSIYWGATFCPIGSEDSLREVMRLLKKCYDKD